jgi:hypothetical protein
MSVGIVLIVIALAYSPVLQELIRALAPLSRRRKQRR